LSSDFDARDGVVVLEVPRRDAKRGHELFTGGSGDQEFSRSSSVAARTA